MSALPRIPTPGKDGQCTVIATGSRYERQPFINCRTCGLTGCYGACAECAAHCHAGHDLGEARDTYSYCDCGWREQYRADGDERYAEQVACKCIVWKEATFADYKAKAEGIIAQTQEKIRAALNTPRELDWESEEGAAAAGAVGVPLDVTLEVDWDSFEHSANPLKTWPYMTNDWYLYRYIPLAIRDLVKDNADGAEQIGSLNTIRLVHVNAGLPDIERVAVADGTAVFTSSFCCYWHAIDKGDMKEGLVVGLGIWSGLRDALYNGAAEAKANLGGVPLITDIASFEFEGDEPEKSRRKAKAMIYASTWRGQRSWGKVADIGGWCSYPSDEDFQRAFGEGGIVIHNRPFEQWGPDENGWTPGYRRLYSVDYDITARMLHIWDVYEREWWQCNASYDVAAMVRQVMSLFRLGDFETMTEAQHQEKIELLRMACTSSKVEYEGDYSWVQQLLSYPCFYQGHGDNHDRRATAIQMAHINSAEFRGKIPEDTVALEHKRLVAMGRDPSGPEVVVGSFVVDKVSFRGMKQERLIIVTDRATYSTVPRYKGSPYKKKYHRISHAYYATAHVGKAEWHTMGTPPMPKPPAIVSSAAGAVRSAGEAVGGAGGAVAGAVRSAVGLGNDAQDSGEATGPFKGPICALRYASNRLAADEKPPKKWKLPEIPDLKGKLLSALRSIIDTLKSISLPSIPKPSMPKFKVRALLDMLRKLKPPMPSMPHLSSAGVGESSTASAAAAETDAGDSSRYSCATGVSSAAQDSIPDINAGLADADAPEIELEWPDLNPIHMLEKIANKIEACAEFMIDLPSKLGIVGVLHAFAKAAGKATGLSALSLPKPDLSAAKVVSLIQGALEGVAGVGEHVFAMLSKMAEEAVHWGAVVISAPKVGVSWLLRKIISVFQSIELPHFDLKAHLPGVSLPKLPSVKMPTAHMPGFVGKIGAWVKGPVRPDHVEYVILPRLPKACSGASRYACLEIGWVIAGAAASFQQSSVSSPYDGDVPITTTVTSGFYNTGLRGIMREGTVSKPSGTGDALTADEAIAIEGPNSQAARNAALAAHAREQLAAELQITGAAADAGAGVSA